MCCKGVRGCVDSNGCVLRVFGVVCSGCSEGCVDTHSCVFGVLGGTCGNTWMCSQVVRIQRVVWIVMGVFSFKLH